MKHKLITLLIGIVLGLTTTAQNYTIYPVPHLQKSMPGTARLEKRVCIVAEAGIDEATIQRAEQVMRDHALQPFRSERICKGCTNLLLGINGSRGIADKEAARMKLCREVFNQPKYDRHIVSLTADRQGAATILVLGENTDAAFYGLASIEQMLEQTQQEADGSSALPCATIYDCADLRDRGIIEGYYGVPYSAEVTKDLFRFMARYKMNTYMYGAKSDPYHSQLWAAPYPTSITDDQLRIGYLTQDMLRDITTAAHATKVNFIWAIHPGTAFTDADDPGVLDRIMQKFGYMHQLGVRQFGVFVDDVGVPSDDATLRLGADRLTELQQRIDRQWNTPTALATDTVKPLHYVPQLYAYSWVSTEQGKRFFGSLSTVPEKVRIYITGRGVWTVPCNEDLQIVSGWLGHEVSWWWNYPCNDNDVTKLFLMDTYANFHDEKHIITLSRMEPHLQGTHTLIANPMQQGEASKISLFSVADYAWNTAAFNNHRSYDAALVAAVGNDYADALRHLAPYLRYFDADALRYNVENYRQSVAEGNPRPWALVGTLKAVIASCEKLEQMAQSPREDCRLMYADLRPWLLKLKAMAQETVSRLQNQPTEAIDLDNNPDFQFEILSGLGSGISLSLQTAEPAAEYLRPLLIRLRERDNENQ
ncbi:MAG: beta-N-acetylglucosaminidase domain-containing protein [Bacteroidaceae bacterium]|nr:beta-N-acetylglucosaminidase domain-containing protein [Bacteroidaceae bacterium]